MVPTYLVVCEDYWEESTCEAAASRRDKKDARSIPIRRCGGWSLTIRRKCFRAMNYRGGVGQRIIAMGKIGHTELTVTSRRVWASETSVCNDSSELPDNWAALALNASGSFVEFGSFCGVWGRVAGTTLSLVDPFVRFGSSGRGRSRLVGTTDCWHGPSILTTSPFPSHRWG